MAMLGRLIGLAKSPQGRKLLNQAQKAARDPQNRERLQEVRSRFGKGKTAPAQNSQAANTQRVQKAAEGEATPGSGGGGSVAGEPEGRSSAGAAGGGTGEEESRRSDHS